MKTLFINARVVTADGVLDGQTVLVDGEKIAYCGAPRDFDADEVVDVRGDYLSAGFIDVHVHGGNGHDFMDGTKEAYEAVADYNCRHGVTSILATTLAGSFEETAASLEAFNKYAADVKSCNYLGMHLEGPYVSPEYCGALDPKYIVNPDRSLYEKLIAFGCVKRMTIAPELPGSGELCAFLKENGVEPSIGHTGADFTQVEEAVANGFNCVTHLYSCMTGVHRKNAYRHGGVIEAGLLLPIYTEVIADGKHLPECILRLIYKCKGRDKIILVTDAIRGAGLREGETTTLGSKTSGLPAIIEDGVAKLPDRSAFAGSVASADRLIRTIMKLADVPLHEAVTMMTVNPATHIGVADRKGAVKPGMDADLIVFDKGINVKMTMTMGNIIRH